MISGGSLGLKTICLILPGEAGAETAVNRPSESGTPEAPARLRGVEASPQQIEKSPPVLTEFFALPLHSTGDGSQRHYHC